MENIHAPHNVTNMQNIRILAMFPVVPGCSNNANKANSISRKDSEANINPNLRSTIPLQNKIRTLAQGQTLNNKLNIPLKRLLIIPNCLWLILMIIVCTKITLLFDWMFSLNVYFLLRL
jgi:hypothetical protein